MVLPNDICPTERNWDRTVFELYTRKNGLAVQQGWSNMIKLNSKNDRWLDDHSDYASCWFNPCPSWLGTRSSSQSPLWSSNWYKGDTTHLLPSGKQNGPVEIVDLTWFNQYKLWFSIVMLVYQRLTMVTIADWCFRPTKTGLHPPSAKNPSRAHANGRRARPSQLGAAPQCCRAALEAHSPYPGSYAGFGGLLRSQRLLDIHRKYAWNTKKTWLKSCLTSTSDRSIRIRKGAMKHGYREATMSRLSHA